MDSRDGAGSIAGAYVGLLVTLGLVGCAPRASAPAPPVTVRGAPSSVAGNSAAPDIRDFGYIEKLTKAGTEWKITIDYADLLRGEAARKAAIEDGEIGPDDPLDNDLYVRETDDEPATFTVDPAAAITRSTGPDTPGAPVKLDDLARAFANAAEGDLELQEGAYWFTLRGDRVVKIEELYMP